MSAKIIVLKEENTAQQKHDVLQDGEYIDINRVELRDFLSRAAGNVIYLDDEGKLYANNLCEGTDPDNPTTPSTPDQPERQIIPKDGTTVVIRIGEPLFYPAGSGGSAGNPSGGGGSGGGAHVGGTPNVGGGGLGSSPPRGSGGSINPLGGDYITGTPCVGCGAGGLGGGGGGGCQAPDNCTTDQIIEGWQAQRSGRIGHTDLGEVQKTRAAAYAILIAEYPNLEQLEKITDTDTTEVWAGGGGNFPIYFSLNAITSGKRCDEQSLSNHNRKDRFWPIYTKKDAPLPATIHTISAEGCAICLKRFVIKDMDDKERQNIKVSGKEKAIHDEYEELHLYEMEQFACAIHNPEDYEDWLTPEDSFEDSSFSSVEKLIKHSKTRYAEVKGGGEEDDEE